MTTNAYLFAANADPAAVAQLAALPTTRVVCPLTKGDRALYVAFAAEEQDDVLSGMSDARRTSGLAGVEPYVALPPPLGHSGAYPTYCDVEAWVGFGMYGMVTSPVPRLEVAGLAVVTTTTDPERTSLLVEVTAASHPAVQGLIAAVTQQLGTPPDFEAYGPTSGGHGFSHLGS